MGSESFELLTANLSVIESAIRFASRRNRLDPEDAEEFASIVKLKLVENDYAILRAYERRSSFATFISIVVQRMALDYRIHAWGKWHVSAEAKRLGPLAIDLEQLLHRDGRTLDEALPILAPRHDAVTRELLASLAQRLPARAPRMREVAMSAAESVAAQTSAVEEKVLAGERRNVSERVSAVMSAAISRLPENERLVLQLRFEGGMTVAQIARALQLDQKLLYRQIERRMRDIRAELERSGLSSRDVLDLVGSDDAVLSFELRKQDPRPSIGGDETETARSEDSQ